MIRKSPKTRLQVEREKRNLTQEELAEAVNVPTKTVGRWERSEQLPGFRNRQQLARFFKETVDISWFQLESSIAEASPLLNIPFNRNPSFIDQKNRIQLLRERLTAETIGASRQTISGLGGIGKTQLALAYAYQYQNEYTAVLWVGANTQTQLLKDFVSIATCLQVPETRKTKPKQRAMVNEVLHWLQTQSGWLLIFDNVEERLDEKDATNEEEFLKIEHVLAMNMGHILLTTRSQSVALHTQNMLLEEMQPEEGAQLLLLRTNQQSSPDVLSTADIAYLEGALTVARLLGGLPLALEQARAYIEKTQCGFTEYRKLYEISHQELLSSVVKGSRLDKEYKASVATTWLISFRLVEQQCVAASHILKLYAYLAPDMIPQNIVLKGAEKLDEKLQPLAGNRFQFNSTCEVLLNYSLIKRNAQEASVVSIHRLIQTVLQDRMENEEQHFWAEQATRAVQHAFSSATDEEVEHYIPQAQMCAAFIEKYHLDSQEAAYLLKMVAKAVDERGWYMQAQPLYMQAFNAYSRRFGSYDTRTVHLLFDVIHSAMDMGERASASNIYKKMGKDIERMLGSDYPDLLAFLNNATWAQLLAEDHEGAIQTGMQALQLLERSPDADAVERAKTYQVAAEIYVLLGRIDLAEASYQGAYRLFVQTLGPEHTEVANTLANFGSFSMVYLKNIDQAEKLLRQALEIRRHNLGHDHPEIADALVPLAFLSWKKGHYQEAEKYYQQALAIREQKFGQSHPDVLQTLRNMAELAAYQKKIEEAERYFRQAFTIAASAGETDTNEYALLLTTYADFLREQGRIDEAQEYEKQIPDSMQR